MPSPAQNPGAPQPVPTPSSSSYTRHRSGRRGIARYAVTVGAPGYLPESHEGVHQFTRRKDLAEFARELFEFHEFPQSSFCQIDLRGLWRFITRHGASSAHFSVYSPDRSRVIEFHALTQVEIEALEKEDTSL